ncbi:hypothetical protein PAHAL_9G237900 [Panicum hallii]|uniref:Uncharacterized protein n=1 Tax=Panicum hallii TaxID=206008 RepID=A0A2T8I2B0_9POAL|nr:hypothetical protein PAHAL_9G237900 [Panicum hallii]
MRRPAPHGREPRRADHRPFHHAIFPVKPRAPFLSSLPPPPHPHPPPPSDFRSIPSHREPNPPRHKAQGFARSRRQCCTCTRPDSGSSVRSCPPDPRRSRRPDQAAADPGGAFAPPPPSFLPDFSGGRASGGSNLMLPARSRRTAA